MDEQPWWVSEPPTDRHFLALAIAAGSLNEAAMIVAAWNETADGWQPVKVPGDIITDINLHIVCWTELPDIPVIG
jgi:hypothetical protein